MIKAEDKMDITPKTLRDKKVLVVGLARSGTGAANLLASFGAEVLITDTKPRSSLETNIERLSPYIKIMTDGNPERVFTESDLIVVSPGVPLSIPPLVHARKRGIPVIGELELAYQVAAGDELSLPHNVSTEQLERKSLLQTQSKGSVETLTTEGITRVQSPLFIGVTGTNGKSTTTTLINIMLRRSGFKTLLGGNIGNALTEEILKMFISVQPSNNSSLITHHLSLDFIVTEVSSFQLESINKFRPKVAVILNITPDHLDRYKDMEEYINAKIRIFENQGGEDYVILNADDPVIKKIESEKLKVRSEKPRVLYFSRNGKVEGVYFKDGRIYCNFPDLSLVTRHSSLISLDDIKIKGIHNLENSMAASAVALISGCSIQIVREVLKDFPGLEHRLEFVREINGVRFINDSKATNVGAVVKSLESFDDIILIMGGMDKGGEFSVLRDLIREKVKVLILLGKAKEKIADAVGGAAETVFVNSLSEAVEAAIAKAGNGDVVLLSPGCASFDMFDDFEDRGRRFKEAVREIVQTD